MNNILFVVGIAFSTNVLAQDWRGLVVEAENRCLPYDRSEQYPYLASVEKEIVAQMGGKIYGPYTGRYFDSIKDTDIEHIVATSEAHDSGLCAASTEARIAFASDTLNLTLAAPEINRCGNKGKCDLDAAEWLPQRNQCWFVHRIIQVETKYQLSVDPEEAKAIDDVLVNCQSVEMIFYPQAPAKLVELRTNHETALSMYDDNKNGRISCSEAKNHGIAPVTREHIAYAFMNDKDGDGVVCE